MEFSKEEIWKMMEDIFRKKLPETLYMNHYELSEKTNIPPDEWRRFLTKNQPMILSEIAAITEASARAALKRIGEGKIQTGEAAVIKQLLDRSEQINRQAQGQKTIMMHFIPPKQRRNDDDSILQEVRADISEDSEPTDSKGTGEIQPSTGPNEF